MFNSQNLLSILFLAFSASAVLADEYHFSCNQSKFAKDREVHFSYYPDLNNYNRLTDSGENARIRENGITTPYTKDGSYQIWVKTGYSRDAHEYTYKFDVTNNRLLISSNRRDQINQPDVEMDCDYNIVKVEGNPGRRW